MITVDENILAKPALIVDEPLPDREGATLVLVAFGVVGNEQARQGSLPQQALHRTPVT
jgi:hypothetical protein